MLEESERFVQISERTLLRFLSAQILLLSRGHVAARAEASAGIRRFDEVFQRVDEEAKALLKNSDVLHKPEIVERLEKKEKAAKRWKMIKNVAESASNGREANGLRLRS